MATRPDFDALLGAFMSPDNAVRRQAEGVWEDMKKRAPDEVLESMCAVMGRRDPAREGLRAMTAVLLRTLFGLRSDLWSRVQQNTKVGVKGALLTCLTEEPVAHIRRKVTHAVGQLAGVSASEAEWPELMALTVALCRSAQPNAALKVVGLDLVNILAEFCHEMLSPHEAGLLQMFDACLVDDDISVRVAALKAACSFLQELMSGACPPAASCVPLVLKMMSVLEAAVKAGEEDAARDALEALNVVAAKQPELLLEGQGIGVVGNAMLSLAASPALEGATRELSLELLTSLCENAPAAVEERGAFIVQEVVPLTIHMLAQQDEDDAQDLGVWLGMANASSGVLGSGDGDDDGEEEDELGMVAASALSRVAIALSGKAVLLSALPVCSEFLSDASDWRRRKAGLLTLLLIGEGCSEDMADSGLLPQIVLGPVLSGVGDSHPRVRYAALACLGQMADDFAEWDGGGGEEADEDDEEEGIGSFQGTFHAQLLPALVLSLGGPNANMPRLQAAAAAALITFCNPARMQGEWLYAEAPAGLSSGGGDGGGAERRAIGAVLLEALCELVRGSPSVVVREEALTAVGCVAQVLGGGFGSFYGTFVPLAKEILESTPAVSDDTNATATGGTNTDTLRGKAMEAIALMGQAVGVDVFRPDAHHVIRVLLSEQATVSRDPGNPQSTYTLQSLARIAGVLREEFLPYLDQAVAPLLAALAIDAEVKVSPSPDSATAKEDLEAAGMTAVEMDLRGVGRQLFGVNTSLMQAKEAACKTLYQYTEDLGDGFAKHAARTLAIVLPNLGPRNAVSVQVVSAAIVPRLVAMASRRARSAEGESTPLGEAQAMLDASVDALCEVVSWISSDLGATLEAGGEGDMEPTCIAADSLSSLLGDHCKIMDPSPLTVTATREMAAVTVLRDAAAASMRRTEKRAGANGAGARGHHPLQGLTGAVDSADDEEQEEWEEDLLTSAVDGIGWIIKGRKDAFMPTFESALKQLVLPLLTPDSNHQRVPPSQKSFGLCMSIDVLEHCGESGRRSVFPALLPALLAGCQDEVSSTRQACAYGLGVAADFGGPEFDEHAPSAMRLLLNLSHGPQSEDEENLSVADNALSAAFRVVFARGPVLASSFGGSESSPAFLSLVGSLLSKLPLTTDVMEGQACHGRIVRLVSQRDPRILGGDNGTLVKSLVTALAGVMTYQHSLHEKEAMAMPAGAGAGGGCGGGCGTRESEPEMWGRQLLDRTSRQEAETAVSTLREGFPSRFEEAWAALDDEGRQALQTPTSSFRPHGS